MKNLIVMVLALIVGVGAQGQTRSVEKTESVSKNEEIYLNFKFANDIKVEQWDKNEVSINVSVYLDNGEGNEAFNLKTERNGDQVKIYSDFGDYYKNKKRWGNYRDGKTYTTEIDYVVYVPKGANLKVKSISGSLEATSYTGDLRTDLVSGDITLKKYNGLMRLKTVSGDVDVTIDKALIDAKTVTGTVYSDLDIDLANKGKKYGASSRVKGSINNGEELITLATVSGNIYMRKG